MALHRRAFLVAPACLAIGGAASAELRGSAAALSALAEGGVVVLIRHAAAPGNGDPPQFRLGACETQRNLSAAGRQQAADLGRALRAAGGRVTAVRSSRWCRGLETARLAFPDLTVEPDPMLDSFFDERGRGAEQTEGARRLILGWRSSAGVLALVTHQVNITALTGIGPAEGELVVVRPGEAGIEVVGRVAGAP